MSLVYQAVLVILSCDPHWVPNGHGTAPPRRMLPYARLDRLLLLDTPSGRDFDRIEFDGEHAPSQPDAMTALLIKATARPSTLRPYVHHLRDIYDGHHVTMLFATKLSRDSWTREIGAIIAAPREDPMILTQSVESTARIPTTVEGIGTGRLLEIASAYALSPDTWMKSERASQARAAK